MLQPFAQAPEIQLLLFAVRLAGGVDVGAAADIDVDEVLGVPEAEAEDVIARGSVYLAGVDKPAAELVPQVLLPGLYLVAEVFVYQHVFAVGEPGEGGRDQAHRLQQVGVFGQHYELAAGLVGDVEEGLQPLDVAGAEVGDDEALLVADVAQGAVKDLVLGVVAELRRGGFGALRYAGAFAEEEARAQRGDGVDEPLRVFRAGAVGADVAAVDDPAGGGLHRPGARPPHRVVHGEEAHRQPSGPVGGRREGGRLQPLASPVILARDVVGRAGPELLRLGADGRRIGEAERPLAVALPLGLQVALLHGPAADVADLLLEVGHAGVLHRLGDERGGGAGVDGDVLAEEGDVAGVVDVGVGDEDGIDRGGLAVAGPLAAAGPDVAGGDEVRTVEPLQRRQQVHLQKVEEAGAGARLEVLLEVEVAGGEGGAEIEEEAGVAACLWVP